MAKKAKAGRPRQAGRTRGKRSSEGGYADLIKIMETADVLIAAKQDEISQIRQGAAAAARKLNGLLSRFSSSSPTDIGPRIPGRGRRASGASKSGKRARANPEEIQRRQVAILGALKGSAKGKGLSRAEIGDKSSISGLALQTTLAKMKSSGTIKMEGSKGGATYYTA